MLFCPYVIHGLWPPNCGCCLTIRISAYLYLVLLYRSYTIFTTIVTTTFCTLSSNPYQRSLLLTSITLVLSIHLSSKVWDEIIYPFPNFNGCTKPCQYKGPLAIDSGIAINQPGIESRTIMVFIILKFRVKELKAMLRIELTYQLSNFSFSRNFHVLLS